MSPDYSFLATLPRPPKPPPPLLPVAPVHRVLPLLGMLFPPSMMTALSGELRLFLRSPAQIDGRPPGSLLTAAPPAPSEQKTPPHPPPQTERLTQPRRQLSSRGRPRPLAARPRPQAPVGSRGFRLRAARAGSVALPWREPGAGLRPRGAQRSAGRTGRWMATDRLPCGAVREAEGEGGTSGVCGGRGGRPGRERRRGARRAQS